MKKRFLFLLPIFALVLASCGVLPASSEALSSEESPVSSHTEIIDDSSSESMTSETSSSEAPSSTSEATSVMTSEDTSANGSEESSSSSTSERPSSSSSGAPSSSSEQSSSSSSEPEEYEVSIFDTISRKNTEEKLGSLSETKWGSLFSVESARTGMAYSIYSMGIQGGDFAMKWNDKGYMYISANANEFLFGSITCSMTSGKYVDVYGSKNKITSTVGATKIGSLRNGETLRSNAGYKYIYIKGKVSGTYIKSFTFGFIDARVIDPTGISFPRDSYNVAIGTPRQLSVLYAPHNANHNTALAWTKLSGASTISIDESGVVSATNDAQLGDSATIQAALRANPSLSATCTVKVAPTAQEAFTLLVYMCGSNLERPDSSAATNDLKEIIGTLNQPDDVNIAIETGGCSQWSSYFPIQNYELGRWHVQRNQLVKDAALTLASMGESSTLQSFLEYGFANYPAEKCGLVLWNHGTGMKGCCLDENFDNDSLTNAEVYAAVTNARQNAGISQKLDFIAYDACRMGIQDIAEMNSSNFHYMVSSQESENFDGYSYDDWLPMLYENPNVNTEVLLMKIVDGFMDHEDAAGHNDQTQAVLNLDKMGAYRDAWETFATKANSFVTSQTTWNSFKNTITANAMAFVDSYDAKGALQALYETAQFDDLDTEITIALNALDEAIVYHRNGAKLGERCCGLNAYLPNSGNDYKDADTNFDVWRAFVDKWC